MLLPYACTRIYVVLYIIYTLYTIIFYCIKNVYINIIIRCNLFMFLWFCLCVCVWLGGSMRGSLRAITQCYVWFLSIYVFLSTRSLMIIYTILVITYKIKYI